MSLELDFLAELVKQPNMECKTADIAHALGWTEKFSEHVKDDGTYGRDLAHMICRSLASRKIVILWKGSEGHFHVRLVRPNDDVDLNAPAVRIRHGSRPGTTEYWHSDSVWRDQPEDS